MKRRKQNSVIISTCNRQRFIVDPVRSVLDQDIDDVELIVDDGSLDWTQNIQNPYMKAIRYIYQVNQSVSAAQNRGVRESFCVLLAFLGSDVLWSPRKLKAQIDKVGTEDVLSFEGVGWFVDLEECQAFINVIWPHCNTSGYVIDPILDVAKGRYFHMWKLLCRNTFLQVGCFDECLCMGEYNDWFSRASLTKRFHYISKPFLKRRFHQSQVASEREECLQSLITVFSNIKARAEGILQETFDVAQKQLASKWFHLANRGTDQGRSIEATSNVYSQNTLLKHSM